MTEVRSPRYFDSNDSAYQKAKTSTAYNGQNLPTIKRDALGRAEATTRWLSPRGAVDVENVPIAGLGGVPKTDGLTSQTFYDDDLTDNTGLDSSGGLSVPKLGGGTYNIQCRTSFSGRHAIPDIR